MGHGKVGKEKCRSPCIKEGVSNELVFDGPHNFTATYFIPETKPVIQFVKLITPRTHARSGVKQLVLSVCLSV